jgi:CTP synthase
MSPYQHGEVFVTDDGTETDLDLGHYERFIDESLNVNSNVTTGKVYWNVLTKERNGEYLGQTVQVIPHITDEIKERIYSAANSSVADVTIVEIGGTVGDIESQPFLESIRQVSVEAGRENCLFLHVVLIPYVPGSGEYKSKPTQHSVKELLSLGIQPDILVCRCDEPLEPGMKSKIAMFCNVSPDCVIDNTTVSTLYEAPLMLEKNGLGRIVCRRLGLTCAEPELDEWKKLVADIKRANRKVTIAIAGKYVKLFVLSPYEKHDDENDSSIVLKLIYKDFTALFTGDVGADIEEKLCRFNLKSDVLKIAHHGSSRSVAEIIISNAYN